MEKQSAKPVLINLSYIIKALKIPLRGLLQISNYRVKMCIETIL